MVSASKILTVSYGTFSCTLEGFDDPFSTMKAIAEYFRDLAAEDRYFGAEPPTPDAEMLHRIAEREIQRRVEAKINEHGVVLRQTEPGEAIAAPASAPVSAPAVAVAAVAAAAAQSEAAPEAEVEAVAEVESPVLTEEDVTPMAEEAAADAEDLAIWMDAAPAEPEIAEPAAAPAPVAEAEPDSVAAKLMRIRAAVEEARRAPAVYEEDEGDADFAPAAAVAADDFGFDLDLSDDIVAAAAPVEAEPEMTVAEVMAEEAAPEMAAVEAMAEEAAPEALAAPDVEAVAETEEELLDEAWETAEADEIAPEVDEETEVVAEAADEDFDIEDIDLGEAMSEPDVVEAEEAIAEVAEAVEDEIDLSGILTDEDAAAPEAEAEFAAIRQAETDFDAAYHEQDAPVAEAEDIAEYREEASAEEHAAEAPDVMDAEEAPQQSLLARARARILKVRRPFHHADDEDRMAAQPDVETTVAEEPVAETIAEADEMVAEIAVAEEAVTEAYDEDAFEADLAAALSDEPLVLEGAIEEETAATTPEVALATDDTDEDESEDVLLADIGAVIGETGLAPEEEDDLARQLAEVEDDTQSRRDPKEARAILESAVRDDEGDVSRLMEEAKSKLEGSETRRRVSAISHLKAAVAATVADRKLKSQDAPAEPGTSAEDEMEVYRDDLSKAVRPRRPVATEGAATRRPTVETRPAPLMLVSELRVDRPADAPADGAVVRPRRITTGNLALTQEQIDDEEQDEIALSPEEASNFAEFAERLGASSLADLLEAAAAYTATVEGMEHFSRPHLMRKVASVAEEEEFSREDGLRSFGMLLRQGKIQKVRRGQFSLSQASKFMAEARRVGQ